MKRGPSSRKAVFKPATRGCTTQEQITDLRKRARRIISLLLDKGAFAKGPIEICAWAPAIQTGDADLVEEVFRKGKLASHIKEIGKYALNKACYDSMCGTTDYAADDTRRCAVVCSSLPLKKTLHVTPHMVDTSVGVSGSKSFQAGGTEGYPIRLYIKGISLFFYTSSVIPFD